MLLGTKPCGSEIHELLDGHRMGLAYGPSAKEGHPGTGIENHVSKLIGESFPEQVTTASLFEHQIRNLHDLVLI